MKSPLWPTRPRENLGSVPFCPFLPLFLAQVYQDIGLPGLSGSCQGHFYPRNFAFVASLPGALSPQSVPMALSLQSCFCSKVNLAWSPCLSTYITDPLLSRLLSLTLCSFSSSSLLTYLLVGILGFCRIGGLPPCKVVSSLKTRVCVQFAIDPVSGT